MALSPAIGPMSRSRELDEINKVAHVVGSSKDRKSNGWKDYWEQNSVGASLMLTLTIYKVSFHFR